MVQQVALPTHCSRLVWSWARFNVYVQIRMFSCVHVGFLQVFQVPFTSQQHAFWPIGDSKLPLHVSECVNVCMMPGDGTGIPSQVYSIFKLSVLGSSYYSHITETIICVTLKNNFVKGAVLYKLVMKWNYCTLAAEWSKGAIFAKGAWTPFAVVAAVAVIY